MHILILLLLVFVPAICYSATFDIEKHEPKVEMAIAPIIIAYIVAAVLAVAAGVYSYVQTRRMQKKNSAKANQMDGTIADEGTSFYDIAGSPHVYGNITHIFGQKTSPIKSKGGK